MTLEELAAMVKATRDAQRAYFKTKSQTALQVSKDAERRLDAAVDRILHPPQPGLFDDQTHARR